MIHVSTISRFATGGRVWRSFDHLIAAGPGTLLLVPIGEVDGDMTSVTDGCPVPWAEAWAVLDAPVSARPALAPEQLVRIAPMVAAHMSPYGWVRDIVPAHMTVPTLTRLTGTRGERYALLGAEGD